MNMNMKKISVRGGIEMRMIFKPVAILLLVLSLGLPSPGRAQWIADGVPVVALANTQSSVQMVEDGAGGAYIVWQDYRNPANGGDIYMQRINSRGEPLWAEGGIAVAEGTSLQKWPSICLDTAGSAFVTYIDGANICAQRVNRSGELLFGHDGVVVYESSAALGQPYIVTGSSASAIIGWIDERNGNPDIYAQRVTALGTISWNSAGIVICNAANDQGALQMIADGSGGAIFMWEDNRDAAILPIYAQKVNSSGTVQWTANGYRICGTNTWMYLPKIVSDGAGGAYVVWYDMRNGTDNNVWAQRMLSGGTRAWASAGVSVCSATGEQTDPDVATDGSGGAIFTWVDARTNPPYTDIYAQRFNSSGVAQWTANGLAVSDPAESQKYPVIVSDGAGGAIVAWQDQLFSNAYDIRAQRIDGTGAPQWLMQGENVCTAPLNQSSLQMISDGDQGAIMAWNDERAYASTNWDIYAQRMEKHGYWGYPCPLNPAGADVPYDQGGVVLLTWDASYLDAFPEELVTRYVIWRSTDGVAYSPLDSIDAYYLESYQYAAATTADSSESGTATHCFKIRANTFMALYWWESEVIACHSVDNLTPVPPTAVVAEQSFEPAGLNLTWAPNTEPDLAGYAVYRGTSADFVPDALSLVASPMEASWFDGDWRWNSGFFYKVSALDANGNESGFALVAPDNVSGVKGAEAPRASYLAQNFPNPFNPATRIGFGLKTPARVSLRIYDAAGRLVRMLVEGNRPAGTYAEPWDGKDDGGRVVASGIYFYRLDAGAFTQTRKMVLLK
jgi:hypothetical protein